MHRQATRATARRRRRCAPAPPAASLTWADVGGFLAMSAITAIGVLVALGWAAGIDRWPWWSA